MITCTLGMDDAHGDECWWVEDEKGPICQCYDKPTAIRIAKLLEPGNEPIIQAEVRLADYFKSLGG